MSGWPGNLHSWLFLTPCTFRFQTCQFLPNNATFKLPVQLCLTWYIKNLKFVVCFIGRCKIFCKNSEALLFWSRRWLQNQAPEEKVSCILGQLAQTALLLRQSADWLTSPAWWYPGWLSAVSTQVWANQIVPPCNKPLKDHKPGLWPFLL